MSLDPHVETGERTQRHLALSANEISSFARLVGDANPVHHDERYAAGTRFGGIIASGPQLSSLMMGLSATHFSQPGSDGEPRAMLGLDFRFRFRRAVHAGETLELAWEVVAVRPKPSLGGSIAFLAGRATNADGVDAVKAVGKVLVVPSL